MATKQKEYRHGETIEATFQIGSSNGIDGFYNPLGLNDVSTDIVSR